jgi:hypothetical protein
MRKKYPEKGFTIAELLIATTIFSMVLIVILSSFLQVGRMFYKGVSVNNTNEAARNIVDAVASDARISKTITNSQASGSGSFFFCVGSHRYTYKLATKVNASDIDSPASNTIHAGMVQDTVSSGCPNPSSAGINPKQLLGPDMQLNQFSFTCSLKVCPIPAHLVFYGSDNTVFDSHIAAWKNTAADPGKASGAPDAFCSGNSLSTQFCATSDINTNVTIGF